MMGGVCSIRSGQTGELALLLLVLANTLFDWRRRSILLLIRGMIG